MLDPGMLRAPVNLQSLNKITLSEFTSDSLHCANVWGGIFHHPSFVNSASQILGLRGESSIINIADKPVGSANLLYGRNTIFHTITIPQLFQYFGPIFFNNTDLNTAFEAFEEFLTEECDFAYLSFPPGMPNQFPPHWISLPQMTLALLNDDLKSWGTGFRDDVKNKISKARREKVEISACDSLPEELWRTTFARKKMPAPLRPESLTGWCRTLIDQSLLKIFVAKIDGQPVAFRGELAYGDFAYDWIAGSNPDFHSSGANQLLMAEIGNELAKRNFKTWDLVGGQVKPIAAFKKSFGAREISYFHAFKCFNIKGRIFHILRQIKHG
jgi:hypothetical protein